MRKTLCGKAGNVVGHTAPAAGPEPSEEAGAAVRALARSAFIFRGLFVKCGEGQPIRAILEEHHEVLVLASEVLDRWLGMLGIDPETGEDKS
jgi:hypothetical protein